MAKKGPKEWENHYIEQEYFDIDPMFNRQ
ncbi:MAG: autoinducer binding domain-containing protein [Arenicella sp.]